MNLKHNKIFNRIAAIAMMVAMAITLLPGIGNTGSGVCHIGFDGCYFVQEASGLCSEHNI